MVRLTANEIPTARLISRDDLDAMEISPGFRAIVRSAELRPVLQHVLQLGGAVTAALHDGMLIGYATDLPFVPIEWSLGRIERRWERLPGARELGSLEVATPYRGRGIAHLVMDSLVAGGRLEPYIVIGEALAWHWDIGAAGVDLWRYRGMLLRLLESAGFAGFDTDDAEIRAHEANFLVARIGAATSAADRSAFREALW
jgi:acetoin utilization protein AcuA